MKNLKILLLLGSIRIGRQSPKIAHYLQRQLNRYEGVDAEVADLVDYPLPMMEERYGIHPDPPAIVQLLGDKIRGADAIVFISPEYAGSFSGVLKNAVDYFGRQISGKPVGVVTTSGGLQGGVNASHQLQQLILCIQAFPMPKKLLIPMIHEVMDNQNETRDERVIQGTAQFVQEFLPFAQAITAKRHQQFNPVERRLEYTAG